VSSELVSNSTNKYKGHPNGGIRVPNSEKPIQRPIPRNQTGHNNAL
jgi:hypothetical protein